MKRAPWYVVAGAMAGFASVLGLHGRAATFALPKPGGTASAAPSAGNTAGTGAKGGASAGAAGPVRSATGQVEAVGYGELSVKVTVSGNRIAGLSVPLLRVAEPTSQQIADQAIPMLKSEVLAADGARISAVTGATYTSEAYAASVQSALDKLHVR
jgi:uncharacterized protein with FMN-binding domain